MDPITLHQPPGRPWGMPNLSPFCTKLETYLRIAEVPHTVVAADFRKAPKGKIPFVSLDGKLFGDSQLVIEELERRLGDRALDAGLPARDRALARMVRRTLDEAFYFVGMYFRWLDDEHFRVHADEFKKLLPGPLRLMVPMIRRQVRKASRSQGTGRHSADEIAAIGIADLDAFAELLGDRPFLVGDRPRTVDASLFAFVDALACFPVESPVTRALHGHRNLVDYRARIRARWWADLAS